MRSSTLSCSEVRSWSTPPRSSARRPHHRLDGLVIADTREQVAPLNAAIRDHRLTISAASDGPLTTTVTRVTTAAGEQLGVGDRIATRRNDRDLGVANRDRWTITRIQADGGLHVLGPTGHRALPAGYVHQHVELAYATTAHGAQGETVHTAHLSSGSPQVPPPPTWG